MGDSVYSPRKHVNAEHIVMLTRPVWGQARVNSFSLAEMVLTQHMQYTGAAARKGLELLVRVDDSLPDLLTGDIEGVRALVDALIGYAVNRTASGVVELTVTCREQRGAQQRIIFCVRDTGPELDPTLCTRFGLSWGEPAGVAEGPNMGPDMGPGVKPEGARPLSYGDAADAATADAATAGVGAGDAQLAHCADLAWNLGGGLWVHSAAAMTTFVFEQVFEEPADSYASVEQHAGSASDPAPGAAGLSGCLCGIRILLVEDNLLTQNLAMKRLLEAGAEAVAVASGEQALEMLMRAPFDVALVDVLMPGISGFETVRRIRELGDSARYADLASLPVLGMSLATSQEMLQRVLAAGMDGLVPKPVQPDIVRHALYEVCGL